MALQRWLFHDPDGAMLDWTFPMNPASMQEPEIGDAVQINNVNSLIGSHDPQVPQPAVSWQFEGVVYTNADHDRFEEWMLNARPIDLTDHFNRTWRIYLENVDLVRAATRRRPERYKYTARAQVLERVA